MGTETIKQAQDFGHAVPQPLLAVAGMMGGLDAVYRHGFQAAIDDNVNTIADRLGLHNYPGLEALFVSSDSALDDAAVAAITTLTASGNPADGATVTIGGKTYRGKTTIAQINDFKIDVAVAAAGLLTATGQPADTQTITIGAVTYTLLTILIDAPNNILIGATTADTIANIIAAVTAGAGAGTLYGTGTTANPDATASQGAGTTMVVTALVAGAAGNSIDTTDTLDNAGFAAATLLGGSDATASDTLANLNAAVNAGAGSGTAYFAGTTANTQVTSVEGASDTLDFTAITAGAAGNAIATTDTSGVLAFTGATMSGGIDGVSITVTGLSAVGVEVVTPVSLNGTTPVALGVTLSRVTRIDVTAGTPAGSIYVFAGDDTAGVPDDANRTYMTLATPEIAESGNSPALSPLKISSSSASDDSAGTGARTVRVTGLDVDYGEISYDVTMDGQTEVVVGKLMRVFSVQILTSGSGGTNAGDIYVSTGGVTAGVPDEDDEIFAKMLAGEGETHAGVYTVPLNKTAYIARVDFHSLAATNSTLKASLAAREYGGTFRTIEKRNVNIASAPGVIDYSAAARSFAERCDIELRGETIANTADVAASMVMFLVDDE